MVHYLTKRQLNLSKNARKGPFKESTLIDLFFGLNEELKELKHEAAKVFESELEENYINKFYSEIGDVGAYLVGIAEKINHEYSKRGK